MIPKIDYPVFSVLLPISNQEVQYRPMTMKEEKILLTAQQSKDTVNVMDAMFVCLKNCIITDVDIKRLPWIDLQFFFLNLRSKSVGKIATIMLADCYDQTKNHKINIDVENVVVQNPSIETKIFLTDTTGIITRHPLFKHIRACNKQETDYLKNLYYVRGCINSIFDGEGVYSEDSFSDEELIEYLENLTPQTFEKINNFVNQSPKIEYIVEYDNSKGERKKITFDTLENFF